MKKLAVLAVLIAVLAFSACSNASVINEEDVSFSVSNTTVESISDADVTESADTTTTKPSTTEISTTQAETTTKAAKQTTAKQETTTQKQTTTVPTTAKETTTKAETTTAPSTCTNNGNHSQACGNMGKWFNSKSEVKAYAEKEMKYWADLEESGQITREEYYQKCPSGYECWSCAYCGRWTGNFKY